MTKLPIKLENDEPVISTLDIAIGIEVEHPTVFKMIKKFKPELESIRNIRILNPKKKGRGRPISYCFLNEEQSLFLVTLMRNFPLVVKFKKKLANDFIKMRSHLKEIKSRQQSPAWIAQRQAGKITRREETDTIKEFVDYAVAQGSKSANRYYVAISKMQNKSLFLLEQKFKNLRNILNLNQLATVDSADAIVAKAIKDGMSSRLHYKEIYKLAKSRVETFAELRGKTFIPASQQIEFKAMAN